MKRHLYFIATLGVLATNALPAADARVEAALHIPPAETYVLGDEIPLMWRFTNRGDDPLAMLWEGCCRLNGKLDIRAADQSFEVLPPGAASFHTYSKAETLPPGREVEFPSRLADWVSLPRGGEFELGGRYTGVLPSQTPQVPNELALWRGTATTGPTRLKLLDVADYLAQRVERQTRRQLALSLSAPAALPPLEPVTVTVTIENLAAQPTTFAWPGALQLWLVDEAGLRLAKTPKFLRVPGEVIELPATGRAMRTFTLIAADLEDSPFGRLQMFLDLATGEGGEPRLPSAAVSIDWRLGKTELITLLNAASDGPSAGMRNPPLKLLRVHLPAVHEALASIPDSAFTDDRTRELKRQLELAGCVQSLQPGPGPVFLPVDVTSSGGAGLGGGIACDRLSNQPLFRQVGAITGIRRHLGWDLTVEARPAAGVTLGGLFALNAELSPLRQELAGPLTLRVRQTTGQATNLVQLLTEPSPANVIVRLAETGGKIQLRVAGKDPVPGRPPWLNMFSSTELREVEGETIPVEAFADWLKQRPGTVQPVVFAAAGLRWEALIEALQPLVEVTIRLPLVAGE